MNSVTHYTVVQDLLENKIIKFKSTLAFYEILSKLKQL